MYPLPTDPKKIKDRIRRYERGLRQDIKLFGSIDDGAGKRYLLGPLYMMLGDVKRAIRSYRWLEEVLPDDSGDPFDYLCWSLALYRSGDTDAASKKLLQTMLKNLYLLPALLGLNQERLDVWHSSNLADKDYVEFLSSETFPLWDEPALKWAGQLYRSPGFREIRERYIEIGRQLKTEPVGPKRSQLVDEWYHLSMG